MHSASMSAPATHGEQHEHPYQMHLTHVPSSQSCTFMGHSRKEVDFPTTLPSPNFQPRSETSTAQPHERCFCQARDLESSVFICKERRGRLVKPRIKFPKQILVYRTLSNCITFPLIKFSSLLPQ